MTHAVESKANEILENYRAELEAKLTETGAYVSQAQTELCTGELTRETALAVHQAAQLAAIAAEQLYHKICAWQEVR